MLEHIYYDMETDWHIMSSSMDHSTLCKGVLGTLSISVHLNFQDDHFFTLFDTAFLKVRQCNLR